MSEPSSTAVECPICGEGFDPTAAGGWCTNPECGEWQYLGEEVPEPAEPSGEDELGEDTDPADDEAVADSVSSPTVDESEDQDAIAEAGERTDAPAETADSEEASAEAADSDAVTADAADAGDSEPAPDSIEFTAEPGESAGDADESVEADADEETPGDSTEGAEPERPGEADLIFKSAVELEESEEASIDAVCPSCGTSVEMSDNFCPDCGTDLHEPPVSDCPECGADVDPDDAFCGACGADLEDESPPERLALRARGEEVLVTADQTVGREIRRLLTDTGGAEDEAVRIHREHVRIVREDGQFYLVDLGDNPTEVNGHRLSKGDREPIGPGDEIGLSGVVTLSVGQP